MKIVHALPPNWPEIHAAFPRVNPRGTYFCYGPAIYNPGGGTISAALLVHEEVHSKRQGDDPAGWWRLYIESPQFRFDEELPAHIAEYQWFAGAGRGERRMRLRQIAQRLASPLYGRMITVHAAKRLISGKDNPDG